MGVRPGAALPPGPPSRPGAPIRTRARLIPGCAAALTLVLGLSSCGDQTEAAAVPGGPVEVAASTDVYGAIAKAIGGDRVRVTSFIDNPGADPGAYESTPADAVAVQSAQLVIGNGGGYDDFVFQLAEAAGGERTVLDVAEFSALEAQVPAGEEFNEHIWFDLEAVQRLGDEIAARLGAASPDDAAAFTAGADAFREQVEQLRTTVAQLEEEFRGARVAATEPLPLYLLADAGVVNATPEEFMEASEEGTDAPAAVVQEALELVTGADPVRALLLNTQTQTPATDRLRAAAEAAGVPEVPVFETLSEGVEEYVPWMGAQIDALADALRRTA